MTANKKILTTSDYRIFIRNAENRPVDIKKHRKLEESMKKYGFLHCFPIACARDEKQRLIVKDGQHRLAIAETLGLPVHWVEESINFDIALVNSTAKTWTLRDYAEKFAHDGKVDYQAGLDFTKQHGLPIGTAFCLLAGTVSFSNMQDVFYSGEFKIRDEKWANAVAGVYGPLAMMSSPLKNARFTEACMAVCRVASFDAKRLLDNTERCREKLVAYSTKDAYLQMLEDIYNFGRTKIVALRIEAIKVMHERSAVAKKKKPKAEKSSLESPS